MPSKEFHLVNVTDDASPVAANSGASPFSNNTNDHGVDSTKAEKVTLPSSKPILKALLSNWIVDTGATSHTTVNRDLFVGTLRPYTGPAVLDAGGKYTMPQGISTMKIHLRRDDKLNLANCLFNPDAGVNLIATAPLQKQGVSLLLASEKCTAFKNNKIIFTASLERNLLWL